MTKRVLVLMGGNSAEREVSLDSGNACAAALKEAGYQVETFDTKAGVAALVAALKPAPDVVFNALHGPGGEDGSIQGLLNLLGVAYTHSGLLASALAMDKPMAKRIFKAIGLRCPEGTTLPAKDLAKGDPLPPPYVVKPAAQGSSVGVEIVTEGRNSTPLVNWKKLYGETVLVERFIPGRELTVGVMGDKALAVTEIRAKEGFYDYRAKYTEGYAVHVVPAEIPADVTTTALAWALEAHQALGCRGVSRADFRYDDRQDGSDGLYLLEVNTQPGMTALSLVPEQAKYLGIGFPELCAWMVENARCDA